METKEMICIVCPIGCKMKIIEKEDDEIGICVKGNKCPRGANYAIKELKNPTRVLTSTVVVKNALINRLPVKSSEPISKGLLKKAMEVINKIEVRAPVAIGDIIIKNILNTGVDIVSSKSMDKV